MIGSMARAATRTPNNPSFVTTMCVAVAIGGVAVLVGDGVRERVAIGVLVEVGVTVLVGVDVVVQAGGSVTDVFHPFANYVLDSLNYYHNPHHPCLSK